MLGYVFDDVFHTVALEDGVQFAFSTSVKHPVMSLLFPTFL